MLDLCFIIPDSDFLDNKFVIPNLTPILLKSYLNHYSPDKKIKIIYLSDDNDYNRIPEARLFGISFLSSHLPQVKLIYSFLKNKYPNSIVLAGGAHVNAVKDEVLNSGLCDYYIAGQAENALFHILNEGIQPCYVNNKKSFKYEWIANEYKNVKLNYEDIDVNKYSSWLLITDYGCPYQCSFCHKSYKGIFYFPFEFIKRCIEDFIKIDNYKSKILKLTSDNVLLNFDKFIPMFNLFKEYEIQYEVVGRLDLITEEKLKILKNTGCKCIKYGVETGSPRLLKLMNKGETIEDIENGLKLTEESKLPYGMYLIVNYPSETDEDVELTIDLINKFNPNFLGIYQFTPYPGSPVWNKLLTEKQRQKYINNNYSEMYHAGKEHTNKKIEFILSNIKNNY